MTVATKLTKKGNFIKNFAFKEFHVAQAYICIAY